MIKHLFYLVLVYFLLIPLLFSQDDIESSLVGNVQSRSKVNLAGYGELHYNYRDNGSSSQSYLDFHRFVLFFGYNFNEQWSFKSEVELEHNFVKDGQGELELEQAHINFTPFPFFNLQAGVLLVAAGLINETHEPPLFLSVERPFYHNQIIPTTWFGNGFAIYGKYKSLNYRLSIMEGLQGDGISQNGIRGVRGKGFYKSIIDDGGNNNFKNPLFGFYVDYQIEGLKVGLSGNYNRAIGSYEASSISTTTNYTVVSTNGVDTFVQTNAITTTNISSIGEETDLGLIEFHVQYINHGVFATLELATTAFSLHSSGVRRALGGYLDLGYNVLETLKTPVNLTIWGRYSWGNTAFETQAGGDEETDNLRSIWRVGASLKPISEIVIKLDYGQVTIGSADPVDEFNLGLGYYF